MFRSSRAPRILFVTGEYPAMQGGVGDYTRRLSQALGELGVDVHVLTHVSAGADYLRASTAAREPTVHPVLEHTGWSMWSQVTRAIGRLRPSVVNIQYQSAAYALHPAVNLLPWRLRALQRRPGVIATFHDLRSPYLFPKAGWLRHCMVLALARGADACIVTNPADWLRLKEAGLGARLRPIPIGSNITCMPPAGYDRESQRARWGADADTWLLAYFGFLNAGKDGETLVRSLAELVRAGRPARLLMVGGKVGASDPTNVAYLARVEALIADLGLVDRVVWTGFTPADEVSANLLAADCAVLPYSEGASLRHGSLMAALAHGLPIVSTAPLSRAQDEDRVFPQLVQEQNGLLAPPGDPLLLAAAVTRVMSLPDLRARLSEGASALSRQFEWGTIARRHLEAYRELR